jgi:hypothetical protein
MPVKKKPVTDYPDDPDEIPCEQRLEMAWEAYIDSNEKLSIRKAAKQHGVKWRLCGIESMAEARSKRRDKYNSV